MDVDTKQRANVMFPVEFERACAMVAAQLGVDEYDARLRLLAHAEAIGEAPDVTAWAVTSRTLRFEPGRELGRRAL
jgi:hypothetical protein